MPEVSSTLLIGGLLLCLLGLLALLMSIHYRIYNIKDVNQAGNCDCVIALPLRPVLSSS